MKIGYFGGDLFFPCMEMLVQDGHEIISLHTNKPPAGEYDFTQRVRQQARTLSIPIADDKPNAEDITALKQAGCEMILTAGYPYKIPPWDGDSIRYGVNIHPSLLPVGAGPMPLPYVILKGLKETGITLHELQPTWDTGNILLQESFPLYGNENIEDLFEKSSELAVKLTRQFLESPDNYWQNSRPQKHSPGDYWPMPKPEDFLIEFDRDGETVCRHLRAHRFVNPAGEVEYMTKVSFTVQKHELKPGTVIQEKNGAYLMTVGDGMVQFTVSRKKLQDAA